MKKQVILGALLIISIFTISGILGDSIQDNIPIQIQTTDASGNIITGTFTFQINISNSSDCSNVLYSNTTTLTTDARGIVSYQLTNVTLPFNSQYYFCYYRNGALQSIVPAARTPYAFTAKNISASGIMNDSNLNISNYNITANYGFFNYLLNIINIGSPLSYITNIYVTNLFASVINATSITASGNITATGNVSGAYIFGNGSQLTGIPGGSNPSFTNVNISNLLTLLPQLNPTNPFNGSLFFNSSLNAPMFYNGTTWIGLPGTGFGSSIVSSGSNANGYWIQYADGTMMEWGNNVSLGSIAMTNIIGGLYFSNTQNLNFPVTFVSPPSVQLRTNYMVAGNTIIWPGIGATQSVSNSSASFYIVSTTSTTSVVTYDYVATGRWTNLNLGTGSGGGNGIVNTITNANGTCTQWANGIQECSGFISNISLAQTTGAGADYTLVLPATFTQQWGVSISLWPYTTWSGVDLISSGGGAANGSVNSCSMHYNNSIQTQNFNIVCTAIGRWTTSTNINTPDVSTWGLDANGNIVVVNSSKSVNIGGTNYTTGNIYHQISTSFTGTQVFFQITPPANGAFSSAYQITGSYGVPSTAKMVKATARLQGGANATGISNELFFTDNNVNAPSENTSAPEVYAYGNLAGQYVVQVQQIDIPLSSTGKLYAYTIANAGGLSTPLMTLYINGYYT